MYIAWINRDGSFSDMVYEADNNGLWVQNAVERDDGSIYCLGAPMSEGGAQGTMRLYNSAGIAVSGLIGNGPPQRVEWSPDRSAVLVISGGRVYLAKIDGSVNDITDQVAGTRAINWVSGNVPHVDSPSSNPPAPVGQRSVESPNEPGTPFRVLAPAGLNIRSQPTTTADIVASVVEGDTVWLLTGPPVYDGPIVWWEVRDPNGVTGWIAAQIDGEATLGP